MSNIYCPGKYIIQAVIADLISNTGITSADQVRADTNMLSFVWSEDDQSLKGLVSIVTSDDDLRVNGDIKEWA